MSLHIVRGNVRLSDAGIRTIRDRAAAIGDGAMVLLCEAALRGDTVARDALDKLANEAQEVLQ